VAEDLFAGPRLRDLAIEKVTTRHRVFSRLSSVLYQPTRGETVESVHGKMAEQRMSSDKPAGMKLRSK
jgi:hypothetical protein